MQTSLFDPGFIGSTYSDRELLTYLYLENAYLKAQNPLEEAVSPFSKIDPAEVAASPEYDLVCSYLKETACGGKRHLIIANDYPNVGAEYGNGFVHRRAQLYRSYGATVDILVFGKRKTPELYSYEGSTVLSGYVHELIGLLSSTTYDTISIHFLNQEMWNCLAPFLTENRIFLFLHGYEARRWIRQSFEHKNPKDLQNSIARTFQLQAFWKAVIAQQHHIEKFIFVSNWWKRAVFDDMELTFPQSRTEIIHNFVDTELFRYVPKPPEQRFKILWVRSASARNYGNDLAIQCLKRLQISAHWDKFEVKIVGDGKYFDEFFEAFGSCDNVSISRGYLTHDEIAALHKDFGVFLVPTRLDSQGVSRDEAMSSGLVPVTNAVTAVPEFVDESCSLLAPSEDASQMGDLILGLVDNPGRFSDLSRAAASRVRSQSAEAYTVAREAQLMGIAGVEVESRSSK